MAVEMLNDEERQWLNAYHARVRNVLTPLLEDEAEQLWLKQATAPI
jgi:Xaa-Pro aminopeptidase